MFSFIMYAADTTLCSTLKHFSDSTQYKNKSTESLINDELRKIIEWLNINKLSLNKDKFYYKYIHRNLPVYLLNWEIIPNYNIDSRNTRNVTNMHTSRQGCLI